MGRVREKIRLFLDLVRFEHSIFALPYAYIGALYGALAAPLLELGRVGSSPLSSSFATMRYGPNAWTTESYWPTWQALFWITVVMVGARSLAFIVNRALDAEIDARNPRTAGRAIPAGLLKAWELWLFAAIMLAAFLYGVWQLAPITRWLWPIVLAVFLVYPYTKRFTPLCHYWLGLCLGLAPVGAWVAVGASIAHPAPWIMGLAVALWTAGFDIIYATQDIDCDVRDGVHSMPADLGVRPALLQTRVLHALTVALLIASGVFVEAGWPWYAGVGVAGLLLAYENVIVSAEDLTRVNAAFFTTNGVIAVVVGVGALADRLVG